MGSMSDTKTRRAAVASRRDFLRRTLKVAAYTAPIIAGMSVANFAAAQATAPMGMGMGGMMGGGMMGMM